MRPSMPRTGIGKCYRGSWKLGAQPVKLETAGLEGGKVLTILGKDDGVIVMDETMEDACVVLGQEGVHFAVIDGGHKLPLTCSEDVVWSIESFRQRT